MSKNQLIDELFELFDSILEKSFKNKATFQSLIQKYPSNELLYQFEIINTDPYEDQSRVMLKQYTIEELQYLQDEAQTILDQVMNEELNLQKLALRINRKPISPTRNYKEESWDFLIEWPKCKTMDNLINTVRNITNQICLELQRPSLFQQFGTEDDIDNKYQQALIRIKELEEQTYQQEQQLEQLQQQRVHKSYCLMESNKQQEVPQRKSLINELELKLEELEIEKNQNSLLNLDAFSKLLSLNQ